MRASSEPRKVRLGCLVAELLLLLVALLGQADVAEDIGAATAQLQLQAPSR